MASLGGEQEITTHDQSAETTKRTESREGSVERKAAKERDDKLKVARERQNEERQRKIEELKAQAEAAQRYREQKEEERRRRIEEIRQRDSEKRTQVEERKKAIMEAEKERREYILRKNIERESRIEVKKRERNSIGYAFGSSTPRLLEPADFGMVSPSTFWGQRRSTSISNVAGASLSRRSSERELNDCGSKKRATSASGTERHEGRAYSMNRLDQLAQPIRRNGEHIRAIMERERREQMEMMDETESLGGGRRSGRKSAGGSGTKMSRSMIHLAGEGAPRPKYNLGSRSGNVTPGGHASSSRPGSAMSTSTTMSTSGFINRRSMPAARKPRPASIAGTVVSLEEINKIKKENKPPVKNSSLSPSTSAQTTPKRSTNMMSTSLIVTSSSSRLSSAEKKTPIKREPLTPKATTPKPLSKTASSDRLHKLSKEKSKDIMSKSAITPPVKTIASSSSNRDVTKNKEQKEATKSKEQKEALNQVKTVENVNKSATSTTVAHQNGNVETDAKKLIDGGDDEVKQNSQVDTPQEEKVDEGTEKEPEMESAVPPKPKSRSGSKEGSMVRELAPANENGGDPMTASMMAKSKITTEEEAKAALAERRRLAREEAERQAELERQRLEAERLAELKRQEEEAERQRQFEEEAMRMAEEQRKAEEERLRQAIEEAKQREEEEKRKREEEERQRQEREAAEKKAKEDAERLKLETEERLKREEKEREERRKRVEAIMSRTRRGGANTTPNSTPTKENNNSPKPTETVAVAAETAVAAPPAAQQAQVTPNSNDVTNAATSDSVNTTVAAATTEVTNTSNDSGSTSGSNTSTSITPSTPAAATVASQSEVQTQQQQPQQQPQAQPVIPEPQNSQAMYEQSVIDKENSLINSFSNMIIDENVKNMQQNLQQQQQLQSQIVAEETTFGKQIFAEQHNNDTNTTTTTQSVANGNGHHIESINNKNEIDLLQTIVPSTNQLIDLSLEPQDNVNFNNNNSLITTNTTLVTADSHENKDISLL
ncbi:histone-lysine N-methyltransferase, H3 lysine-79 specific isoform X6 [Musca domestica]|uniref:Histone-lysine N-methyltransferase, H3 lysine-79 specific isoform X7 n=1 Tax=Musca domestica TaxID=7370 RepID=A0A1I8M1F0_MUSDO|nr:histone-lysine N-methyltransferase, H3 lysine-79 specific isoform X6 [Musca domestica]